MRHRGYAALSLCGALCVAQAEEKPIAATPLPTKAAVAKPATTSVKPAAARPDRLDLDTTIVTGNRELPKVLYIVPWKKSEIGDLPAQPFNTLLDEALTPVDRDVFRREVKYFQTINGDPPAKDKAAR